MAVPITTSTMTSGYATARARVARDRPCFHRTTPHHSAHPTWRLGIAANWFVMPPSPRGALASPPHQPYEENRAMVSANPLPVSSRRGGAVGSSVKPISPMSVASMSHVRSVR
ncbi:hypothetical protein ADK47_21030 [Streptomyces rimosus subsp. rimosus]|nr:hypothetical protein ADK84_20675 [Streptomyces sp. NRRL WC-3701]KOT36525.1 hypothetical protein ADK42_18845 [Streptomyces rimosus subsp. rimosus]KOT53515.1 hypothetical protein ADK45_32080 [Streptomyces rimosus subsp. rimosus]KOT60991.1 hypothetical protein ADK44_16085 [Streptomyces rimosus subsp. rimosus]KOT73875.1 hypothetical protein ADK48_33130 [Streptomyces rimosus subsp. rimosus]